jgi:hypothetical protein
VEFATLEWVCSGRELTMANTDLLPATVLRRKAVVYVRQSTQTQVQNNL